MSDTSSLKKLFNSHCLPPLHAGRKTIVHTKRKYGDLFSLRKLVRQSQDIKQRSANLKTTILIFFLALLVASCEKPLEKQLENSSFEASKTLDIPKFQANTNTLNATVEDFNDKSIWDAPRLEFIRAEDNDRGDSDWHIYSIDLDGKNVRETISYSNLTQNGKVYPSRRLVRSPNNRYLAGNFENEEGPYIGYIDLNTKKHFNMAEALGPGRLAWAPDSTYVIFYGVKGAYKYTLETKNLEFFTKNFALQLYILADHTIMAIEYPGVAFYSPRFDKLATLEINHASGGWFDSGTEFRLSPSKQYLFAIGKKGCVYDLTLNNPENQIFCSKNISNVDVSFFSDTELVKTGYRTKFIVINFIHGEEYSVDLPDSNLTSLRLYKLGNYDDANFLLPDYPYVKQNTAALLLPTT